MKFYMLDGNEKILCAVPSKDIISLYQNLNYHQADTIEGSLVLSEKYTSILSNVRYFAISDRESNHNFYLYRKTLVQVQNHEIAINGQGAFWDEMQGAYIKDRRPNQVTPADTIKLILGYSRWNVDYVDQMLEEESLRRDMNFYYVSLLDALNTVYQTWQVDIEPYINIEGHQITRRYVKLYQQQGGNNGRRFVYGDNALTVTQQANEGSIFTALVGRGAGVEETDADGNLTGGYSRKINFADVEWSKANGDPCDKPKGQEYVEWKESTELYGYSDGKPRIGIVNFDNEKDPAQLLKETWAQLQQVGVPLIQFQATVGDVGYLNLGETVTIVRYDLNIKYQTRVTGIKWNRCDEAKSQITIGVKAIQSTADKIAGLQQSVAQANVNADEAKSTANHAIIDGTGAVVNYGPNEPTNPKEGDIWYDVQPDGTVVLKQYQNGQWVILIDDTTGQQIKNKVEAQQKELDKAVQDANAASAKADGLVAQVGDANTNAQNALTTAQQNQADLAQAKNDLENTKNQLTNVQSDLTGTKSSLAGAISNISQAQEDLKNTEQGLQGVKSDLANDEKNLSDLTKQAQTQGQTIVNIQKTQSGLSADVADVKGNVSSLQDTANGLQATVKDNQGNISKLQDTANSLQSSITDNKNNIASIKQTAGSIQSTVASMQNAGENLIVNSDFEQGGYHWNLNGWQISNDDEFRNHKIISKTQSGLGSANYNDFSATDLIPVQKGQTISIGVWVKASNVDSSGDGNWGATFGVNWYADNHSGRNHWTDFNDRTYYGNHDWRFLKMEGLQPPADSNFARAHFFLTQNGTAQFALPIMVYGDKLPAWSPSPLDSATATDMSTVEQTVDGLKSVVQSHSGQISQVQQTSDMLQSTVASIQNAGENLIVNSDFEQGSYHWKLGKYAISSDNEFRNHKIVSLTQTGLNSPGYTEFSATDLIPVHAGQTISIGVWTKASDVDSSGDGNMGALFGVEWYPDDHSGRNHWNDYWSKQSLGNHDWQFLKIEGLKVPNDSTFVRAHFFLVQNGTAQFALPIMVYGDKLPAWSPSPLDSATATDMSSVEQTVNGLKSTVQSNKGDISTLKQTASGLESDVQNNKNSISTIKQSADKVQSIVSNMKVGGTNLLPETQNYTGYIRWGGTEIIDDYSCNDYQFKPQTKIIHLYQTNGNHSLDNAMPTPDNKPVHLIQGKQYTFSAYVWHYGDTGQANELVTLYANNGNSTLELGTVTTTLTNQAVLYHFTFTATQTGDYTRFRVVHRNNCDMVNGSMFIAEMKLEEGNVATDWSPSPYDMASQDDLSSVEQTISSLTSTVQSHSGQISQVKQTADSLQSAVTNNSNDISTLKQTATGLQSTVSNIKASSENLLPDTLDFAGWQQGGQGNMDSAQADNTLTNAWHAWGDNNSAWIGSPQAKPVYLRAGTQYTFSAVCWNNGSLTGNNFDDDDVELHFNNNDNSRVYNHQLTSKTNKEHVRYSVTFTVDTDGLYWGFKLIDKSGFVGGSLWSAEYMLVEGNIATAYQPSSTAMATNISTIQQTIDGVKIDVANSKGDISSLKQRADSMESNISDNKNDISDLKQTASSLQSNIQSKADISQITQLSNAVQSVVQSVGSFFPNGNFADSNIQAYWSPWDITKDYTNITFDAATYNGSFGNLLLHAAGGGYTKAISTEYIPVQPNKSVTVSLASRGDWYNSNGKPQLLQCYVHFYDSKKNATENGHFDLNCSNNQQWYDNSTTYDCNSNECYIRVEIVLQGNQENWAHITNVKVSSDGGESISSKISQMADDINMRVQKGDLLSQINIQAGSTLIQSKKLFLDASSVVFSGNAFIPSAAITDLSADKITTGTLNAGNVNIINLDVNKLVGNTTEFVRSGWTNAYGSHVQIDGGGMAVSYGNWYTRFDGNGMTFKNGNEVLGGFTRIGMVNAPSWYNGLAFNAGGDAEFLSIGAQDYGNDSQNPVPVKLLWMRQGINTYGYQPGWNFCDDVWANQVGMNSIRYDDWNIHFEKVTGNDGFSALTLVSGSGNGFYWGSDGSFGYVTNHGGLHNVRGSQIVYDINQNGGACERWSGIN